MPRYFIQISFKGTNYHGWQIQPGSVTVQSVLDASLSTLLKVKITTTGAGRTDTGVHASCFFAHFDSLKIEPEKIESFIFRLNKLLPPDIRAQKITEVADTWHARFDALKRTYHYVIARDKTIFQTDVSTYIYGSLNINEMNQAATLLMQYSDFTSFARLHGGSGTNNCKVYESYWFQSGNFIIYKVTADRFLRNMVRAMVGTMVEIGKGKLEGTNLKSIIESRNRSNAGVSAKAKGLFLTNIEYPPEFGLSGSHHNFPEFLMI